MPNTPPRPPSRDETAAPAPWLRRAVGWISKSPEGRAGHDGPPDGSAPPLSALDAVPDAVFVVGADDQVQHGNRAVEAVVGYAPDALVGRGLAEALVPPAHHAAYRARLREGGGAAVRVPVRRADGAETAADLTVRPVPGATPPAFAVTVREVGPAEAALAAAEGWQRVLRTVVDAIPDPVVAVDRAGGVVLRNRAAGASTGKTLPDAERRRAEAVMEAGAPDRDREEPGADGGVRHTTRVPVKDRGGAVVGLVVVSRDVTAQKEAEARLVDEKRAAEALAHANSEFLATTSHEVRTLMNGVTGMTALLLETALDDEQRDYVDTVRTSSDALLGVINDVLDFSKMEAGLMAVEDRPFDVSKTVKGAMEMVSQQAAAKGLALSYGLGPGVPEAAAGDAGRIRQVLVNLLSNAVKFTDAGTVRVRVDLAPPADGRPTLAFAVEDTGVGIAPDRLEAVFERFAQADDSTARTHGGTGLGLAICRRLAEAMGGAVTAESVPGEGSTFRFTVAVGPAAEAAPPAAPPPAPLPEAVPSPEAAPPAPADAAPAEAAPPAGGGAGAAPDLPARASVMSADAMLPAARVLLAEDNPVNQKVALLTLRRLGYRPDVVGDGAQAVAAVRRHPYDVVLMDIMMPVMGGIDATRHIRAEPGPHPAPAIVALTANAMEGDRERCLEAGCDDYLAKPVAPKVLAATIERAVRSRAVAPAG